MNKRAWIGLTCLACVASMAPSAQSEPQAQFSFSQAKAVVVFNYLRERFDILVVNPTDFNKPLTLMTADPVGLPHIYPLLLKALEEYGYYAFLDTPKKLLEILPIRDIERTKLQWVEWTHIIKLEDGPELLTATLPLATVDARRLKQLLMERLRLPEWVVMEPDTSGNAVRLVATAAQLKVIAAEAKKVDERTGTILKDTVVRSIQLRHVKSARMFQMLTDLFNLRVRVGKAGGEDIGNAPKMKTSPPVAYPPLGGRLNEIPASPPPSPEPVSFSEDLDRSLEDSVSASGTVSGVLLRLYRNDRSNTLVIMTTPSLIDTLMEFINQTDVPPAARGDQAVLPHLKSYVLNYANVQYAVSALAEMFSGLYGLEAKINTTVKEGATAQASVNPDQAAQAQPNRRPGGQGFGPPPTPSATPNQPLQVKGEAQGVVTANIPKKISIIGFLGSNTISVLGEQQDIEIAESLIQRIDQMSPQVLIEVMVGEVRLGDAWQFGVSYDLFNQVLSGAQTGGGAFGIGATALSLVQGATDSIAATISGDKLKLVLNVLQNNSTVNILSVPKVIALNNQPAVIAFQDLGFGFYIEQIQVGVTPQGQPIYAEDFNSFKYSTGLNLAVVPRINESSQVELSVKLQASEITGSALDPRIEPPQSLRSIEVVSRVDKGDTLLIGGLIKDAKEVIVTKIPILGDLPLVGNLFSSTKNKNAKSELIIILTPHLMGTRTDVRQVMDRQRQSNPNVQWPVPSE